MGSNGQTVTCPPTTLSLLIVEESTFRIHIKRCISFRFLTVKIYSQRITPYKIEQNLQRTATKESNAVRLSNEIEHRTFL